MKGYLLYPLFLVCVDMSAYTIFRITENFTPHPNFDPQNHLASHVIKIEHWSKVWDR